MYNCTAVANTMVRLVLRELFSREIVLSLLLFVLALMPLSSILNDAIKGFILDALHLSHMLCLDTLKLFVKSISELESLMSTVRLFSDSIFMSFGLSKRASASIIRRKLSGSTNVTSLEDVIIPALGALDSYKYLG